MVDPHNVTKFDRTEGELEEFALFTVAVAGKKAVMISEKLDRFLWLARSRVARYFRKELRIAQRVVDWTPFKLIRTLDHITQFSGEGDEMLSLMKKVKLGKYSLLVEAFRQLAFGHLNLRTCPCSALESIPGIGFKTSRFFVLHSRPGQNDIAVLDTHVLHFLRDQGIPAPKSTPSSPATYARLESQFLKLAKASKRSVADFDLEIWRKYTKTKPIGS